MTTLPIVYNDIIGMKSLFPATNTIFRLQSPIGPPPPLHTSSTLHPHPPPPFPLTCLPFTRTPASPPLSRLASVSWQQAMREGRKRVYRKRTGAAFLTFLETVPTAAMGAGASVEAGAAWDQGTAQTGLSSKFTVASDAWMPVGEVIVIPTGQKVVSLELNTTCS